MWILQKFMPILNCISKENIRISQKILAPYFLLQFLISFSIVLSFFYIDSVYRRNQELIKELSMPAPGSNDLYFPTKYSQSFLTQCKACFWKQNWSYWRNPRYYAIRFLMTMVIGAFWWFSYLYPDNFFQLPGYGYDSYSKL